MKKLIIAITLVLCTTVVQAENENAATSKEYVDTELATKQPTVPAEGTNVVMTFDSSATDGIGTKEIYDPSGSYAAQQNALVTAATANSAVQMAINGEFYCKEWSTIVENDCWLWGIKETTNLLRSPVVIQNAVFDSSTAILSNTKTFDKNTVTLHVSLYVEPVYGGSNYIQHIHQASLNMGKTVKTIFTTPENAHYILIKHNDTSDDVKAFFEIEPSTTYTIIIKAIETDLSVVGGMKLQLMLVRGNYDGTEILPYGENVFIPQNQQ